MATTTEIETIHAARHAHMCSWCGHPIEQGAGYRRYRFFDGGDAGTVKLHPECCDAMRDADMWDDDRFMPGDNPRGCNCGFHAGCEKCHPEANR